MSETRAERSTNRRSIAKHRKPMKTKDTQAKNVQVAKSGKPSKEESARESQSKHKVPKEVKTCIPENKPDTITEPRERERIKETKESSQSKRELYYAPADAVEIIVPFLKNLRTVWDPACGSEEQYPLKQILEHHGHRVVCTDILMGKDYDFFTYKSRSRYDIMVTTPPYSYRKEFILRAIDIKKPFAFLVPMNVLESKTLRDIFTQNRISVIYPSKNTNFISPDNNKSIKALPYSVWIVWGVGDLPPVVYL